MGFVEVTFEKGREVFGMLLMRGGGRPAQIGIMAET